MNELGMRRGERPRTHMDLPHSQLDQQPTDLAIRAELASRAFALSGVVEEPSGISVPGARAPARSWSAASSLTCTRLPTSAFTSQHWST